MSKEVNVSELTSFGYVKDGKVFLKGYLSQLDREIGDVRESEDASLQYFIDRFELARKKVGELLEAIETAENKGSYLMKLIHMRTYLAEFDGLGDFVPLYEKLDEAEEYLGGLIATNKQKNLQIKADLISELDDLKDSFEWKETSQKIFDIKDRWIKTGKAPKEEDEQLERSFQALLQYFFDRRNKFYEDRQKMYDDRCAKYESLIFAVARLRATDPEAMEKMKQAREDWKLVGEVPVSRMRKLWRDFKFANTRIMNQLKPEGTRPPGDVTPWLELIVKAESLVEKYHEDAGAVIKFLQDKWKKAGYLPNDKKDELINRFRLACDRALEKNHLIGSILRRYADFMQKPQKDQLKIQISQMRYLLKRDQDESEKVKEGGEEYNSGGDNKFANSKLEMLQRRVHMKSQMLKEFEEQLNAISE